MSQDPLGLQRDLNAYRYVNNGPTSALDPSGRVEVKAEDDLTWYAQGQFGGVEEGFVTAKLTVVEKGKSSSSRIKIVIKYDSWNRRQQNVSGGDQELRKMLREKRTWKSEITPDLAAFRPSDGKVQDAEHKDAKGKSYKSATIEWVIDAHLATGNDGRDAQTTGRAVITPTGLGIGAEQLQISWSVSVERNEDGTVTKGTAKLMLVELAGLTGEGRLKTVEKK